MGSPLDKIIARAQQPDASEDDHQIAFFALLPQRAKSDPRIAWVHAIPNGGTREKVSAGIMVASGTRAGVWDVHMPFTSGRYPFGYIEFKREKYRRTKDGGLSDKQVQFGRHLAEQKAFFAVVYSYLEGIAALEKYLKGESYYG